MAILGVQLVFSMVMASFLSKLSGHFSFARWLLCGKLVRYLHPTEDELRTLAGIPVSAKKGKKDNRKPNESFTVPKNLDIQLESTRIRAMDILPLHFYQEFQWLVDYSGCACIVYLLTEIYYLLVQPRLEFNLSLMWCILALGFSLKVLFSLTAMYFRAQEGGERILCVVFGFFFLVMAMAVLIVDEQTLEFGLVPAYRNFSNGAHEFLKSQGIDSQGPASLLAFRIVLAITGAVLGAFVTFPGLRLARMHGEAVKYADERPFMKLLLHFNMVFPMFISLTWVKPIARDYLVKKSYQGKVLMNDESFEAFRICMIMVFCVFRLMLIWPHLQSHLNMAYEKMQHLKKEVGRISSVELQKIVARVFYYLCVVALQYIAPLILLLFSAFMLKTLGDISFSKAVGINIPGRNYTVTAIPPTSLPLDGGASSIASTAAQFSLALANLRQVFTPLFFKGLFSFLCWWICSAWFLTSAFGMVYYSFFTEL